LLVPGRLPAGFAKAKKRWMQAISACGEDTNVFTSGGEPLPAGWNDSYVPAPEGGQWLQVGPGALLRTVLE
jgi:hypothetical protein